MMQSIEDIIYQAEAELEGFLITHPISKLAVEDYLLEHLMCPVFPGRYFPLDLCTSRDLPEETHTHFKQLIPKYGNAVLERALSLYVTKHMQKKNSVVPEVSEKGEGET